MVLDACCRKQASGNYEMGVSWRGVLVRYSPYSPVIQERKREEE